LTIAAIVSLGVGLYEDLGPPQIDANGYVEPDVHWVEGVAIIVAIVLVITVGSVNDYQKEKQFRKLNAKKEDRDVRVSYCDFLNKLCSLLASANKQTYKHSHTPNHFLIDF
jgi:Ca2+-transporting ATPase